MSANEHELCRTYKQIKADEHSHLVVGDVNINNVYSVPRGFLPATSDAINASEDGSGQAHKYGTKRRLGRDRKRGSIELQSLPRPVIDIPNLFTVPYSRDDGFIDRKGIFQSIEIQCSAGKPALLCGLGGTGKSQVAIEYAYRFRDKYTDSLILWVFAVNGSTILQSFRDIAKQLRLPGNDVPEANCCHIVANQLRKEAATNNAAHKSGKPWLLIVDNIDSLAILEKPFTNTNDRASDQGASAHALIHQLSLPLSPCQQLLITSRNQDVAAAIVSAPSWIEIGPLPDAESLTLLKNRLPQNQRWNDGDDEDDEAKRLLDKLNFLPLAITHAATFMARSRLSPAQYLATLEKDGQQLSEHLSMELQDPRRPRGWPNSVFETLKISFEEIKTSQPLAAKILSIMSMLNEKQIPRSLFTLIDGSSKAEAGTAIGTILSYSLASFEVGTGMLDLHSLVSLSIREWLREQQVSGEYALVALRLLADGFPRYKITHSRDLAEKYKQYSILAPHATTISVNNEVKNRREYKLSSLLQKLAYWQNYQGLHSEALSNALAAYDVKKRIKETDRPETMSVLNLISRILVNQGQFAEAEELQRQALRAHKYALGAKHDEMIEGMGVLAVSLSRQEKHFRAQETCREALDLCGKGRDAKDKHMLRLLRTFARVLKNQGNLHEAELMMRQALDGYKSISNLDNIDTIVAQEGLCDILLDEGKASEAVTLLREVLDIRKRIAGADDLHTVIATWSLATALRKRRDYEEALVLFRQVLPSLEAALGHDNIEVLKCQSGLLETELEYESVQSGGPLPDRWCLVLDQDNETVFEHQSSGVRSWTDPRFLTDDVTKPGLGPFPGGWVIELGSEGQVFYVNCLTDEVVEDDPRLAALAEGVTKSQDLIDVSKMQLEPEDGVGQPPTAERKTPASTSAVEVTDSASEHSGSADDAQQPLLRAPKWVKSLQTNNNLWNWTNSFRS